MNVDCPLHQHASLKRSNSAPMINEISASTSSPSTFAPPRDADCLFNVFSSITGARRCSTSSSNGGVGIGIGPRLAPRVKQLRREECIDVVASREVAHEKEIHCAMQISQSWEDLTFETEGLSFKDSSMESPSLTVLTSASTIIPQLRTDKHKNSKKVFDPLSLNISPGGPPSCSSPSPTRSDLGQRRCYSPSLHSGTWKNGSLSPSPTRKAFATRRSLSPISIRPSSFSSNGGAAKRKCQPDETLGMERLLQRPIKRTFNSIMSYSSRTETIISTFSTMTANGALSVGTPESLSSADSRNFLCQLEEDCSPSSNRLLQNDDTSMPDSSNDLRQVKPMEADVSTPVSRNNFCGCDNR